MVVLVDDFVRKPIFRWAGGKQALVAQLLRSVPKRPWQGRYFEPFLGAASLFIALQPANAHLSDLNGHLIETYVAIRDEPGVVSDLGCAHARRDSEVYYYAVREAYNRARPSPERAAQFLYLNRACFNGVFRVNRLGAFNVPYGHKQRLLMPSQSALAALAQSFKGASLVVASYQEATRSVASDDFVYLDPPYPPLNGTAYFTHYTKERFGADDQKELAAVAEDLRSRGSDVLISNADTPLIRHLYAGWNVQAVRVARHVGYHGRPAGELLITSYDVPSSEGVWDGVE